MKKHRLSLLVVFTIAFACFTLGFFLGRVSVGPSIQVSVPASMYTEPKPLLELPAEEAGTPVSFPVNINTATKEELMALPGIGEELAQRILDYRKAVVLFSAPEELMNVKGIGEERLMEILYLITIGG